jgi:hypothetical protein
VKANIWRVVSNNFTKRAYFSTANFKTVQAFMEFKCVPETDYDELVREDDILNEKLKA